jgi:RecQ family ATP-dependent DNA helicase
MSFILSSVPFKENYRRLNMKAKGGKKKFGNFKLTGSKLKRFQWFKKNQNQKTNVNYDVKDDENEVVNENLYFENDNVPDGVVINELPELEANDDESSLIFKVKKKKASRKSFTKKKEKEVKIKATKKTAIKKVKGVDNNEQKSSDDNDEDVKEKKKKAKKKAKTVKKIQIEDEEVKDEVGDEVKKKKQSIKKKKIEIEEDEELNGPEEVTFTRTDAQLTVFDLNPDGSLPVENSTIDSKIEKVLKKNFNFNNYKPLQKEAILRILCGQSTIALFSTGYGKSLIYQICTKFYRDKFKSSFKCLVLVISPLISLMNDQLINLNKCITGASCDSQMDEAAYKIFMENLNGNKIDLLFVSPEGLLKNKRLNAVLKEFKILFVCIDEVHCLSQWSHNFRPSYLQICKILKNEHNVNCILGLTATATLSTIDELKSHFHLNDDNILRHSNLPRNLILSVSKDANKEQALISLLKSSLFITKTEINLDKIIIYCSRREQTDKLATILRMTFSYLHNNDATAKKFNFNSNIQIAESYHAGLTTTQRKRIQNAFLNGKLRIIIATLAFGMGINMKNIRAVIHFNMPKAIESYVQEIGLLKEILF